MYQQLPWEIQYIIFNDLSHRDIVSVSCTCKQMATLRSDDYLWSLRLKKYKDAILPDPLLEPFSDDSEWSDESEEDDQEPLPFSLAEYSQSSEEMSSSNYDATCLETIPYFEDNLSQFHGKLLISVMSKLRDKITEGFQPVSGYERCCLEYLLEGLRQNITFRVSGSHLITVGLVDLDDMRLDDTGLCEDAQLRVLEERLCGGMTRYTANFDTSGECLLKYPSLDKILAYPTNSSSVRLFSSYGIELYPYSLVTYLALEENLYPIDFSNLGPSVVRLLVRLKVLKEPKEPKEPKE